MSIRDHGGAVRYWRHVVSQRRVVECADGKLLYLRGGRWRDASIIGPGNTAPMTIFDFATNPQWEKDTRSALSAAITRTNREARRRT